MSPTNHLSERLLLAVKMQHPFESIQTDLAGLYLTDLYNDLKTDDHKKAFWINNYNAWFQILRKYQELDKSNIYIAKEIPIAGHRFSLDDIEHRILRPIWQTPLTHYAVNCASLGCPNLNRQAFTADNTESLLRQSAIAFVNHPRGVAIDAGDRLTVSSIYTWFKEDFGGADSAIIEHLKHYAKADLSARLENIDAIAGHQYDWRINKEEYDTDPAM